MLRRSRSPCSPSRGRRPGTAWAQDAQPAGKPILTISGNIDPADHATASSSTARRSKPSASFDRNQHAWYKGSVKFEGVSLDS